MHNSYNELLLGGSFGAAALVGALGCPSAPTPWSAEANSLPAKRVDVIRDGCIPFLGHPNISLKHMKELCRYGHGTPFVHEGP